MSRDEFAPVTPGEVLAEEFLPDCGIPAEALAAALGVAPGVIDGVIRNETPITAELAVRLGLYFGNTAEFWLNLQSHHELKLARRNLSEAEAARIRARRAA